LGDLLRKWFADGTAAGNDGDWYDNRDGGHSNFDLGPHPQIRRVEYTDAERGRGLDYALQGRIIPRVVFGNSSTSAIVTLGGSCPRRGYSTPAGLATLYAQYTHNNIYIYPSHRDYHPGHNGVDGYGDMYPTNTPYLIISQGSSGTDQPFMEAVASTLAAFRPEVKRRLVEAGLLMPTIQMIFRRTNSLAPTLPDYLTARAHPTIFEGFRVSDLKMAQMAHAILPDAIPPMVQLRVVEEPSPAVGRDFFDFYGSEHLGDTPAVIARVFRGRDRLRRMVVSAEASFDLNKRPLTYHWVVLRGDAALISIKVANAAGSVAEITVPWHERSPIAQGSPVDSNRIDIGVFVNNGAYYSAPAYITSFCLDDEARTYDDAGRPVEIGYGVGETRVTVTDWPALLGLFKADAAGPAGPSAPAAALLNKAFQPAEIAAIVKAAEEYAGAASDAARQAVLARKRDGLKSPVDAALPAALAAIVADPELYAREAAAIDEAVKGDAGRKAFLDAARRLLVAFGVACDAPGGKVELTPIRDGATPAAQRLTRFERAVAERFNGEVLGRVIFTGMVNITYERNYVDPRMAAAKSWRDVYRYNAKGECVGWTRYDGRAPAAEFNQWGLVVLAKDSLGRCIKGQAVRYDIGAPPPNVPPGSTLAMTWVLDPQVCEYEYADDNDWRGRLKTPATPTTPAASAAAQP